MKIQQLRIAVLGLALGCFWCNPASSQEVPATVVVCIGDSITEGYMMNRSSGYPAHLQPMLAQTGKPYTVINEGKGGEATYSAVFRTQNILKKYTANIVIIMEGANDVTQGISPSTTSFNLENMAQQAQAAGAVPIVSTITPNSSPSYAPENYNPLIRAMAERNGFRLVDSYMNVVGNWSNLSSDGLHPTAAGARIMAEGFYRQVVDIQRIQEEEATAAAAASRRSKKGCFIATAAFGSPLEPQVLLLQKFRDQFLLSNEPGRSFVQLYYSYSPTLADFISKNQALRSIVQLALLPLLALAWLVVEASLFQQLTLLMLGLSLAAGLWQRRQLTPHNED